jgi:acid phosphatase
MEENQNYSQVIGSPSAPTINALASANSNATNYHGVIHPSVNNYLAFVSGQTYTNITDSCTPGGSCSTSAPNLADQVEASGRTWKGYFEDMPSPGFDTYTSGKYVARHNPFVYFNQIRTNPARNDLMVPYTQLAADLQSSSTTPNFLWVTPNLCDDMHDCSVAAGDTWLKDQLPTIFNSPAWKTQRSLLIITSDEDDFTSANQTFWVAVESPSAGARSSGALYNHYSTLRTLESAWGLGPLANASTAPLMSDLVP